MLTIASLLLLLFFFRMCIVLNSESLSISIILLFLFLFFSDQCCFCIVSHSHLSIFIPQTQGLQISFSSFCASFLCSILCIYWQQYLTKTRSEINSLFSYKRNEKLNICLSCLNDVCSSMIFVYLCHYCEQFG